MCIAESPFLLSATSSVPILASVMVLDCGTPWRLALASMALSLAIAICISRVRGQTVVILIFHALSGFVASRICRMHRQIAKDLIVLVKSIEQVSAVIQKYLYMVHVSGLGVLRV